jgi:hypothetical protein
MNGSPATYSSPPTTIQLQISQVQLLILKVLIFFLGLKFIQQRVLVILKSVILHSWTTISHFTPLGRSLPVCTLDSTTPI